MPSAPLPGYIKVFATHSMRLTVTFRFLLHTTPRMGCLADPHHIPYLYHTVSQTFYVSVHLKFLPNKAYCDFSWHNFSPVPNAEALQNLIIHSISSTSLFAWVYFWLPRQISLNWTGDPTPYLDNSQPNWHCTDGALEARIGSFRVANRISRGIILALFSEPPKVALRLWPRKAHSTSKLFVIPDVGDTHVMNSKFFTLFTLTYSTLANTF